MKTSELVTFLRQFMTLVYAAMLVGCASALKVTDPRTGAKYVVPSKYSNVPGIGKFAKLCAEREGREINQVVYVDGYFDQRIKQCETDCWLGITESPFTYLEFQVDSPKVFSFIKEPGIWMVYKTSINDADCDPKIKKFLSGKNLDASFENQCLAVKKKHKVESRYGLSLSNSWIYLPNQFESKILEQTSELLDLSNNQTIAKQVYYIFYPKHNRVDPAWAIDCDTAGVDVDTNKGIFRLEVLKAKGDK